MRGKYIILEGPEGAGKTVVANKLINNLEQIFALDFLLFKEPGATLLGEELRETLLKVREDSSTYPLPKTEALLYFADRVETFGKLLIPHMERGGIGLGVRSWLSTYAYQGGGREIALDDLRSLKNFSLGTIEPDLALLLLINPEDGLKRKNDQEELTRFEFENIEFHKNVYETYINLWTKAVPEDKKSFWRIIDASQPLNDVVKEVTDITVDFLKIYA